MKQGQLIATNGSAQRQAGTVNPHLRKELADQVKAAWRESVRGTLDTARLLHKARTDLRLGDEQSFGEWLVEQEIPLSVNTAYRIAKIAENEAIRGMGRRILEPCRKVGRRFMNCRRFPRLFCGSKSRQVFLRLI